jgi:hypothetical protein
MRRFSSALAGAAVSVALLASSAPAGAASLHPSPAVTQDDASAIQPVGDRRGKHRHRYREPRFSFGFGFPAPRAYTYQRTYRCPYGSYYHYPVGCVAAYDHYPRYRSYPYRSPGVGFEFRF